MAKRKKKDEEEEEFDFDYPDFDQKSYMKGEVEKGKSVALSVALAPIFSFVSLQVYLFAGKSFMAGLLVAILGIGVIGNIMGIIGIDTSEFGKKEWALDVGMFMFTWLAIWIVLMNPPVNDFARPSVDDMEVEIYDDGDQIAPENITDGEEYNLTIIVKVTDNTELKEDSVNLTFQDTEYDMEKVEDTDHKYSVNLIQVREQDSAYFVTIHVEDINGNSGQVEKKFFVRAEEA